MLLAYFIKATVGITCQNGKLKWAPWAHTYTEREKVINKKVINAMS